MSIVLARDMGLGFTGVWSMGTGYPAPGLRATQTATESLFFQISRGHQTSARNFSYTFTDIGTRS
jgi:hypothetical protein